MCILFMQYKVELTIFSLKLSPSLSVPLPTQARKVGRHLGLSFLTLHVQVITSSHLGPYQLPAQLVSLLKAAPLKDSPHSTI